MLRSTRLRTLVLATALVATATACGDDDSTNPVDYGRVRVIHAIGNAPNVEVRAGNEVLANYANLAFKGASPYGPLRVGTYDFSVRATGTTTALLSANGQQIQRDPGYTFVALGRVGATGALAPQLRVINDAAQPAAGKLTIRVLHASPTAGNVDVYLTAPNADIAAVQPTLSNVAYNAQTLASIEANPGTQRLRITTAGTKTVVVDKTDLALAAGQRWLAVAVGDNAPGTGAASTYDVLLRQEP